jgi:hypothetical protein
MAMRAGAGAGRVVRLRWAARVAEIACCAGEQRAHTAAPLAGSATRCQVVMRRGLQVLMCEGVVARAD